MFHIVLYQPEIPPNTGNIIRLCANTGCSLHLIKPLGFVLEDKSLRRAGLDYHEYANVVVHDNLADCQAALSEHQWYGLSSKAKTCYSDATFKAGDVLLFGPETRGLDETIRNQFSEQHLLTLPMKPNNRSLNLSNCAAIVVYEAWRQNAFA